MTQATNAGGFDPMADAMNPEERPQIKTYFGQVVTVDAWACVLQKGVGKVPFDSAIHNDSQRRTAIRLQVAVDKKDGGSYTLDQDVLSNDPAWARFTLPSLKGIGADLRTLRLAWVKVSRRPTGDQFRASTGEMKDRTALVFEQIYPSEEHARAAADHFYTPRGERAPEYAPQAAPQPRSATEERPAGIGAPTPVLAPQKPAQAAPAPQAAAAPAEASPERTFATQALGMVWNACNGDRGKLAQMIAGNPMLNKHFTEDSPEVLALTDPRPF